MKINLFTFRSKILLSLMGTVFLFLVVLLMVVRSEISSRVRWMTDQARARSHQAFNELEHLYHEELLRFAQRISLKNRIPAALQEAVEEDDYQVFKEAAAYELNLAHIPLAVFTDETGQPVVTILDGKALEDRENTSTLLQMEKLLYPETNTAHQSDTATVSGYLIFGDRLFTTHGVVLYLFGRPVGTLTIGFPVDNALAQRMGNVIQAEVGFIAKGKFLSTSPMEHLPGLKQQMLTAAGEDLAVPITLKETKWILVSEPLMPLSAGTPEQGSRVIAVSLGEYLDPLYRIEKVFSCAGIGILLISVFLGISISRGLAAPVRQLVTATQKVAQGDYNSTVTVKSRDELAMLADSFNRMTSGLLLKEQYRGILDKVVSPEVAEEMVKGNITLGGENREVTTLFADIRGFAAMTEGMEPQEVIAMLNEYMEHAGAAIETEDGVVDKYVGDSIMAIFGAPISHPNDPLRAIRAALNLQENVRKMNLSRKNQGKPEIHVGIGINTGITVAGNMGSVKRLNYTVLGESVNIASRLCSRAGPSEILVSEPTFRRTSDHIQAHEFKTMTMKGISKSIKTFKVEKLKESFKAGISALILFLLLLFNVLIGDLHADPAMGLFYVSKNEKFQVELTGRLQLTGYLPQESPSWLIDETDPFGSGRLSLFSDIFWGQRWYGLVELRVDRGEIPSDGSLDIRIQQAFVRFTLLRSQSLHIQVGKFVSPFGDYSQRHDTVADPFIRPPLLHEYRTMICPGFAPRNNDGFIRWKNWPDRFRPIGAPVIWGVPYQAGVMIFGGVGKFGFRAAAMNSAPSSDPVQWDLDFNQSWNYSWVGHVNYRFSPELKLGVSFNYGPYSLASIREDLPEGRSINDYPQIMWGIDATYTRGKAAIRAELIHDTWIVPYVYEDPVDISYYLEITYKFFPGFFGAFRYNAIHFNKIPFSSGEQDQWDYNVQRWQVGVGYRFSRRLEARAEYMWNRTGGPQDPADNLLAFQWIWRF
jgi:class 3 adenylate cyclase